MELENLRNIRLDNLATHRGTHCTEMRFASFLPVGFITAIVINPPESNLAKYTSVHCTVTVAPTDADDCIYIFRAISIYPYGTL